MLEAEEKKHKYASLSVGSRVVRFKISPKKEESIKTGYMAPSTAQQAPRQTYDSYEEREEPYLKIESGISVPLIESDIQRLREKPNEEGDEGLKNVNIKYPLMPANPKAGEKIMAYAHIYFDPARNEVVYNVIEPGIDGSQLKLLDDIKEYIQEKVDINFSQLRKKDALDYVTKIFEIAIEYFGLKADKKTEEVLRYYIFRDFVGLGKIEPFLNDKYIEDISCDGVGINIYIYHRDPRIGSITSNVKFDTKDELDNFVNKLAERCGKTISIANPLLDGTLPDGSRIQSTLGSDIARRGSNFTIRMFTEKPMTPADVIEYGTCDTRMMAYYWFLIEHGSSFLVSGGTATGKTSFLNVLSLFIKPQMKIVSIEDTSELRLPHAHWVPEVARTPISEEGKVDMYELLRESLRQRPDYIIVGEVRGKEAFVLFQQMAVGHAGLATIHAESFPKLVDRLVSPPINLPPELIQNLDVIIFLKRLKKDRKYIRRVMSSVEVLGFDTARKVPVVDEVFRWDPKTDGFAASNKSALLRKIADMSNMTEETVHEELRKRAKVIEYIIKRRLTDYRQIGYIVNLFYTSTDYLMRKIEAFV